MKLLTKLHILEANIRVNLVWWKYIILAWWGAKEMEKFDYREFSKRFK